MAMLLAAALLFQSQTAKGAKYEAAKEAAPESAPVAAAQQADLLYIEPMYNDEFEAKEVKEITVEADFDRSLEDLIGAGGYVYCNDGITAENFPADKEPEACGKKKLTLLLFCAHEDVKTEQVTEELKWLGKRDKCIYRVATLRELLIFGEERHTAGNEFPILALGTEISLDNPEEKDCSYPGLTTFPGAVIGREYVPRGRSADFYNYSGKWFGYYHRILAVKTAEK